MNLWEEMDLWPRIRYVVKINGGFSLETKDRKFSTRAFQTLCLRTELDLEKRPTKKNSGYLQLQNLNTDQ